MCLCCHVCCGSRYVIGVSLFCFKVRIYFEEKSSFCIYCRVAQKRDCEPVTSSVLSFPRVKVGPNTISWKSKQDHFHQHRLSKLCSWLFVLNQPTVTLLLPGAWAWMGAGACHTALWLLAIEVTLPSANQTCASRLLVLLPLSLLEPLTMMYEAHIKGGFMSQRWGAPSLRCWQILGSDTKPPSYLKPC